MKINFGFLKNAGVKLQTNKYSIKKINMNRIFLVMVVLLIITTLSIIIVKQVSNNRDIGVLNTKNSSEMQAIGNIQTNIDLFKQTPLISPSRKIGVTIDGSLPLISLADVVNSSEFIIEGQVLNVSNYMWNNESNTRPETIKNTDNIYRNIEISVNKVLKGDKNIESKIIIHSYGGQIGYDQFFLSATSDVKMGDSVILFLDRDNILGVNNTDIKILKPVFANAGLFTSREGIVKSALSGILTFTDIDKFYTNVNYYINNPGIDITIYADPKEHSVLKK